MNNPLSFIRQEMRNWIDAKCATTLFLEPPRYPGQKLYCRFCRSKLGYFLHLLGYVIGWHTSMICDPLSCGGLYSHISNWLYNLWYVDIYWPIVDKIDRWRRPEYHRQRDRFMRACRQASEEGCADELPAPAGFSKSNFVGSILGKRYFERVAELLKDDSSDSRQA